MAKIRRPDRAAKPIRGNASTRLKKALETLTQRSPGSGPIVTITELCRIAEVSRNALYRYHRSILEAIRKHQSARSTTQSRRTAAEQLRRANIDLRKDVAKLAALVDHYYSAYKETAMLLERRDREIAELRGGLRLRPALVSAIGSQETKDRTVLYPRPDAIGAASDQGGAAVSK